MDTTKTCPNCGKPLASNAPAGLCPECLMQAGFPTGTEARASEKKFSFRPPTIDELKTSFPQLEILAFIGQGGMGAVYKARQPMLDRYVALKILPPEASASPGFTERFTREARALARLSHPNIVAVHEFGQSGGYHYLIMEFVDGVNLREMERSQRLAPAQALSIVPKICEALQYAHDEGVVHRDIKPENILVDKKGRVKIADFGIAKILGAEQQSRAPLTGIIGTPHYMAPEQVEKPQTVDHRADIYSVGVVFYEMLTGELPLGRFAAPSKKVQVDVRLDEVVLRALEKEPELRYQQVSQLKRQVETVTTTPSDAGHATVPAGIDARAFVHWEKRAPGWRIRCRKCGFTDHWGKFGIRKYAVGVTYKFGRCPHCRRFGWAIVERGPVSSSGAPPVQTGIRPTSSPVDEGTLLWVRRVLWVFAALLMLNFIGPHRFDFTQFNNHGKSLGGSQPWINWIAKERPDGSVERTVEFNRHSTAFYSGILGVLLIVSLLTTRSRPQVGEKKVVDANFLHVPLVVVRDGALTTNWPAVFVTGALLIFLMVGAMTAAAGFSFADRPIGWAFKWVVFPAIALVPLWLYLLVRVARAEHKILNDTAVASSPRGWVLARRGVGSLIVAFIIAGCVRAVVEPFHAMNDAVAPEIVQGSTVFVYKLARTFQPGDIVVYRWFATGYPTKYLLGRVAELPYDNQISIERRGQSPQKMLVSDIVGKVIFNTRAAGVVNAEEAMQLTQEGWQLCNDRKLRDAAAKFKKATNLDPTNVEAWNGLGWATFNGGDINAAERAFRQALDFDPNHPAALNGVGQIALAQGRYEEAEKALLAASPAAPASWFGLGRLYLLQGKYSDAEKWLQKIVDIGQGDTTTQQMLEAAKAKHLPDSLRTMLRPPFATIPR